MKTYTAVVEKCPDTGLLVGYIPGFPGAHAQAETLDDLTRELHQVVEMLSCNSSLLSCHLISIHRLLSVHDDVFLALPSTIILSNHNLLPLKIDSLNHD